MRFIEILWYPCGILWDYPNFSMNLGINRFDPLEIHKDAMRFFGICRIDRTQFVIRHRRGWCGGFRQRFGCHQRQVFDETFNTSASQYDSSSATLRRYLQVKPLPPSFPETILQWRDTGVTLMSDMSQQKSREDPVGSGASFQLGERGSRRREERQEHQLVDVVSGLLGHDAGSDTA